MHKVLSAIAANPCIYHIFQGSAGGVTQLSRRSASLRSHHFVLSEKHYTFHVLFCILKKKKKQTKNGFLDTDS